MKVIDTRIPEVKLIEQEVYGDDRGYFMETWQREKFQEQVEDIDFVQDNYSFSSGGILRGIHYQIQQPQGKLVRVVIGEVIDVAVDLRRSSPTFGQWVAERLSAENKRLLWVPEGFGHAFLVLSGEAGFAYKCTNYYAQQYDRSIRWDDPQLAIDWPLDPGQKPKLSPKDSDAPLLKDAELFP